MKRKYKIILISISILFVLGICIGLSYAYYMASASQENTNAITGDCFKLTFADSNDINLRNAIPMSESQAESLTPYEFTIKNICNIDANFDINLETLNNSTLDIAAIRYRINEFKSNMLINTSENDSSMFVNENVKSSNTLYTSKLLAGEEKTFNLRLWIDKSSTAEQAAEKIFKSKIVISASIRFEGEVALLDSGYIVRNKFMQLGKKAIVETTNTNNLYENEDRAIISIQRSNIMPTKDMEYINIASKSSFYPIYAWISIDDSRTITYTPNPERKVITHPSIIYIYTPEEVIYMNEDSSELFYNFINLENIDLSYFDTSKVISMSEMFSGASSLISLDLSNFDTSKVLSMNEMFSGTSSLESLDLSNFNTSNVTDMSNMFSGMNSLTNLNISTFDTSKVTNMFYMFDGMSNLTSLDVSQFNTSNVTNMISMFSDLKKITELNVSSFDTSNVTNMRHMFSGDEKITNLDLSNFNTSNVTGMSAMFQSCRSLANLNISSFDTSKVTDMGWMFSGVEKITDLDLSHFDTSKVTDMRYMFQSCWGLTSLNISSFDTSNVKTMNNMFRYCTNLETIYVGNKWSTSNLNDDTNSSSSGSTNMFYQTTKIVGGAGTTFDANHINKEYAHVDGGTSNPGYFTLKTN